MGQVLGVYHRFEVSIGLARPKLKNQSFALIYRSLAVSSCRRWFLARCQLLGKVDTTPQYQVQRTAGIELANFARVQIVPFSFARRPMLRPLVK